MFSVVLSSSRGMVSNFSGTLNHSLIIHTSFDDIANIKAPMIQLDELTRL